MYFPKLKAAAQQRAGVEQFGGLDRRPGSGAGSLEHMENLWSSGYPALETRPLRRTVTQLAKPNGMTEKDGLFWVDGTALYVNGAKTGLVLTDSRKQLVSMGAYLLIFPDKKYINTQDLTDFGSMENVRATTGEVTFTLCDGTGESLGSYAAGTEAPQEPRTGDLWLDTERSESVMRRYDGSTWTALAEVYTKIAAVGVGLGFRAGDGVTVAGCGAAELNGLHILRAAEDDWVLVPALCRTLDSQTAAVTVMRLMPEMDFVVEQGNRLWGCKYGIVDGQAVNEIYACALGDFRNWNSFAGLSTDSYAAARGSDGPFTGAAACMGGVVFFKENCMERIYPAAGGGHQIVTVPCSGVRKGAERTVAVADGVVYYLGNDGVYAFDGSMPVCVSRALGDKRYTGGVAGGAGEASARRQANGRLGTAASETADGQYETLRSMILKTADQVQKTTAALTAKLEEEYVASSDFGSYVAKLSAQLEAAPEAVTQYYSFFSDLQANVEKVDAAFAHYKLDTEGYIRTGIVYYDGAAPVYGVAVGQDLTCREVDGEKVVEQNNFRAVFTATRLSFWQDATEVAYVSNNRLYITNITVLGGIDVGQWSMEAAEGGLAFRWIGG